MNSQKSEIDLSEKILDWILIGYMVSLALGYLIISGRRFFNFDEFQVVYAGAAILRKGTLYSEEIGAHFPLANLIVSLPCRLFGYNAAVLVISRYMVLALNGIMLLYTYRLSSLLWSRRSGLLAVCMVLSSYVFLEKGIEIRHDVFSTLFSVMGAYYGISYLYGKKSLHFLFSAFCFGMAVASTQKAVVMTAGFALGLFMYLIYERDYKSIVKMSVGYLFLIPIPLVGCLMILVALGNDSIEAFFQYAVSNVISTFAPNTEAIYPFPYDRVGLFKTLFVANPIFYVLGISAIIIVLLTDHDRRSKKAILGVCTAVGLAFYVTAKRPFFQTFLPMIPLLAVIGSGLLSSIWNSSGKWRPVLRNVGGILCLFFLFVFPLQYLSARVRVDERFEKALDNVSFCVENLNEEDKVLCFTQNQIFFDPIMKIANEECGERLYDYDVDCFERKMIQNQCRVIINDYRTQLLSQEIKRRIADNFVDAEIGEILIPGFHIPPLETVSKNIWIKGRYYSPTKSLEIDGKKPDEKLILLEQGTHIFRNTTDRHVSLVYIFDPVSLKRHLESS